MKNKLILLMACGLWLLGGCSRLPIDDSPAVNDLRRKISFANIEGWTEERHAETIAVFLRSCLKLDNTWQRVCAVAKALPANLDDTTARLFWEQHFTPYKLLNNDGSDNGLITGYYEPLLKGALAPSSQYRYPIYERPDDLLTVELDSLYPSLKNKRLRARIQEGKVIPYYSRAEIDGSHNPLLGHELLWVDDNIALFFLHIQGSGLIQLPDKRIIGVGYHDQNGHVYRSIGRLLVAQGEMKVADVNLFSIRQWLSDYPHKVEALLNQNPSYIFFQRRDKVDIGPYGSLGVVLTPQRSIAVDRSVIPLGAPIFLSTVMPDDEKQPLRRLMMAQDTGGAITGDVRADFFWGRGNNAEKMAGLMKTRGQLILLLPRQ